MGYINMGLRLLRVVPVPGGGVLIDEIAAPLPKRDLLLFTLPWGCLTLPADLGSNPEPRAVPSAVRGVGGARREHQRGHLHWCTRSPRERGVHPVLVPGLFHPIREASPVQLVHRHTGIIKGACACACVLGAALPFTLALRAAPPRSRSTNRNCP